MKPSSRDERQTKAYLVVYNSSVRLHYVNYLCSTFSELLLLLLPESS